MRKITEIVKEYNESHESHIAPQKVTEELVNQGYLYIDDQNSKHVTELGFQSGITEEDRINQAGQKYNQILYNEEAEDIAYAILEKFRVTYAEQPADTDKTRKSSANKKMKSISSIPDSMGIAEVLNQLASGINPLTGEVFDTAIYSQNDLVARALVNLASETGCIKNCCKPVSTNSLNRPCDIIFEELKKWRLDKASEAALPPYCIFSDADLVSIAAGDVVYKEDLLFCKGVSTVKYGKYADEIYEILKSYIKEPESSLIETADTIPVTTIEPEQKKTVSYNQSLKAEDVRQKSCDNCQLYRNETCTIIKKQLCPDYIAVPFITQVEKDSWPEFGDATYIRIHGQRRQYFHG